MYGILKQDIWPLMVNKPKEKEPKPEQEPGVRTKLMKDRGKVFKPEKEPNKKPYGSKGDKVRIISYSAPVYIVEGPKERYPVHESDILTENLNDGKKEKKP